MVHLCANGLYSYHRDELYLIICGRRWMQGSIDHPPLTPLLTRVASAIFGEGPAAQRVFSSVAGALVVWLVGMAARRLGGGLGAQLLAAGSALIAPVFIYAAGVNSTNALDQLFWMAASYVLLSILASDGSGRRPIRRWVLLGALVGLGALNKYTMLLCGLALALGVLASSERKRWREPGPWVALLTALAVIAPYAAWAWFHRIPTLEFLGQRFQSARQVSIGWFLLDQIKLLGPLSFLIAMLGLATALRRGASAERRVFGLMFAAVLLLLLAGRGKAYYASPAHLPLLAIGAVECARLLSFARTRVRVATGALWMAGGLIAFLGTLPVLPQHLLVRLQLHRLNPELAQFANWHAVVAQVGQPYNLAVPRGPAILTDSYGTAAAIELLGAELQLPPPLSGSNSYYFWNHSPPEPDEVLSIGYPRELLEQAFRRVEIAGVVQMPSGLDNRFDFPRVIYHCQDKHRLLRDVWPQLRRFE